MKLDFAILFTINLALRIIVQGLLPIFPVFLARFDVSKEHNGFIIAAAYSMLLLSTWLSGKLVPRYLNAKMLFLLSVFPLGIAIFLLGTAASIPAVVTYSMMLFFAAGFNITTNGILIAYASDHATAGRNFGIIGISNLMGSVLGGFIVGPVLFCLGYLNGFSLFAVAFALVGLSAWGISPPKVMPDKTPSPFRFTSDFVCLLIASFLVTIIIHFFLFTSSLLMSKNGYSIKDISIYAAIGMGMAFPSPYGLGWLARKYPPKAILFLIYLLTAVAVSILFLPLSPAVYLIGAACIGVLSFAMRPVVMSLIFDWFDASTHPMAQAYLGMGAWSAAIVGYIFTGMLLQRFGHTFTLTVGLGLIFTATVILALGVRATPKG